MPLPAVLREHNAPIRIFSVAGHALPEPSCPAGGVILVDDEGFVVSIDVDTVNSVAGAVYLPRKRYVCDERISADCFVIASFDVDGYGKQSEIIDAILDEFTDDRRDEFSGLRSINFYASIDGGRVINIAEWESRVSHEKFMNSQIITGTRRATSGLSGVRPIGHRRCRVSGQMVGM